jgi:peptidoglycan/LPS O-acetylase OafA/YrhL
MVKEGRRLGLDLAKGFAAYGVVVIHSLGGRPRAEATEQFVGMFLGFAVPYFLAVSLFLTAGKLLESGTRGFLRGRVDRLIVPYLVWTLIFVLARSLLYAATGRADDLRTLWRSPLPLIFLGESSAQLYFIPLLFTGEVLAVALVAALGDRLRRPSVVVPIAAVGLALPWFDRIHHLSGLKDPALPSWNRVALNEANYAAWCAPYLAGALLCQLGPVRRRLESIPGSSIGIVSFAVLGIDGLSMVPAIEPYFPPLARQMVMAFGVLAAAIAISRYLRPSRWLESLAACTFGIYLMHPLVVEGFELAIGRVGRLRSVVVTPTLIASFAAVAFFVTWGLVAATIRVPTLARFLYGVRPKSP